MQDKARRPRPCFLRRRVLLAAGYCAIAASPGFGQATVAGAEANAQIKVEKRTTDDKLDDIIVTARRRPELLQRTPISVIAFSAKDLEARSITNLRTLQNFVPNLTFAPSQFVGEGSGNVFIRGIGQEDFGGAAEPGVGFYVDGVYFARTNGTLMNLIDIERVEVLRGPQGTLFGKNTIGGAINIVSVRPEGQRKQRFSVILGNYSRAELRGVLNEPLSDKLLMRLSLGLVRRGGYLHRLSPPGPLEAFEQANGTAANLEPEGNDRNEAARLQFRWLLSERLALDLSADLSLKRNTQGANHIDAIDPRFGSFPVVNDLIRKGRLPGPSITPDLAPKNLLESYSTGRNLTNQDLWGASATMTRQLGSTSVRFIAAYRGLRSHFGLDSDGLYFSLNESDLKLRQHQLSAELQLTGTAGPVAYTAGLFAFGEKVTIVPTGSIFDQVLYTCGCFYPPGFLPLFTTERRRFTSDSSAAYTQGTYRFTDRLMATLGARFSREKKSIDNQVFQLDSNLQPTDLLVARGINRGTWKSFTYRVGIEYQATRDILAYGSISKGFKSGGFNSRSDLTLPNLGLVSYKPESAVAYEAGLRSEWLDRKLRLNATIFTTNYTDIQLRQLTIVDGIETNLVQNAGRARIRGIELEVAAVPIKRLTLSAAYGHIDARYLDVGHVANLTLDSRFQRTPRNSLTASVNYEIPVRLGLVEIRGDYGYRSKEQFQLVAAANDQQAYGLLGARLSLRSLDERWSIALFGTNLTNERYRTAGRGTLMRLAGFAYSSIGIPRQVGLQVTSNF
jgi:iron complex outermembrane receptor protein